MDRLGIIADDLTGACDVGAQFLNYQSRITILIDSGIDCEIAGDIPIINTQSRVLSQDVAYRKVFGAGEKLRGFSPNIIFKKIDSALRGNVGVEIDAIMDAFPIKAAFVAPAIPEIGRTTINGRQLINNTPIERTTFAIDPLNPICESDVPTLISKNSCRKVGLVDIHKVKEEKIQSEVENLCGDGKEIIVIDAETDKDMDGIISTLLGYEHPLLLVGSIGLAKALRNFIELPSSMHKIKWSVKGDFKRSVLIVSGSMHETTYKQIERARTNGTVKIVDLNFQKISDHETRKIECEKVSLKIKNLLRLRINVLVTTTRRELGETLGLDRGSVDSLILEGLSLVACSVLDDVDVRDIILIGGETTYHICKKLEAEKINIEDKISPVIVCGTLVGGKYEGMRVVTKGGSVGDEESLLQAIEYLGA